MNTPCKNATNKHAWVDDEAMGCYPFKPIRQHCSVCFLVRRRAFTLQNWKYEAHNYEAQFTPGAELAEMNEMDAKHPGWDNVES